MSLEGIDPPQGITEERALNRGGGFPRIQLIPPQGIARGDIIPVEFLRMLFENGETMLYQDDKVMAYEIPPDWFDVNFQSRIKLTVEPLQVIGGSQTNFQMLIYSTFSDMIGKVQSLGQDIRFAGSDKVQLPYEIERFDSSTGKLTAWINKPVVDTAEITYMYFNNENANDEQDSTKVWINNNLAVWHLNETDLSAPIPDVNDSTINDNVLGAINMNNTNLTTGKIDGAFNFNLGGVDNEECIGPADSLVALRNNFTLMAWVNPESIPTATRAILGRKDQWHWGLESGTQMYIDFVGLVKKVQAISGIAIGTQIHLAISMDNSTPNNFIRFFANGQFAGQATLADPGSNLGVDDFTLAAKEALLAGVDWKGDISEHRTYAGALTDNKIITIFNNESDPGEPGSPGFYEIFPRESIGPFPVDWFNLDWGKRIPLTVNAGQVQPTIGGQSNFPISINSTFPTLIGQTQNQIRFAVGGGTPQPQLNYEIEEFDTLTGKLVAWVEIPTLLDGELLHMYYDNSLTPPDDSSGPSVWNLTNNNVAVWHMNQKTFGSASTIDSTGATANNFSPQNMVAGVNDVAGKLDGAVDFDGVDEESFGFGSSVLRGLKNNITVMAWVKPGGFAAFMRILANAVTPSGGIGWGLVDQTNMHFTTLGVFDYQSGTIPAIPTTSFTHLACVMKNNPTKTVDFYVNGALVASTNNPGGGDALPATGTIQIGSLIVSGVPIQFWKGPIDENRVDNTERSSDYIKTTFNTQDSFSTFFTEGAEEILV